MFRSAERWEKLLDTLPVCAYLCDDEGLVTYFNRRTEALLGRAPKLHDPVDRFCGSFKIYQPNGTRIDHSDCAMALALRTDHEQADGKEIIIERADGTHVATMAYAGLIRDDAGKCIGGINILVDVNQCTSSDEAKSRLASIVESSEDAIISKSLEGRILSWNRGAEQLFGYSPEEAVGRLITLIIPHERLDEERDILDKIRQGERVRHFETTRVAKDGRRIDISLTVSPIRDGHGRVVGASKVARDISLRKQAERSLVDARHELANQLSDFRRLHEFAVRLSTSLELEPILEETLRTAVAIEKTDMGLIALHDSESGRLSVGASLSFDDDFLRTVESDPEASAACGVYIPDRRRSIIEDVEVQAEFAPYRYISRKVGFRAMHTTPLITHSGEVIGVLSIYFRQPHRPSEREIWLMDLYARQAVDLIENARLYNQLRISDKRKDDFLATLAHELRNPLVPICNFLHMLRLSDDLGPSIERVRELMEGQVNHLVRLVDDLLDMSRFTRNRIDLRREPVELASIVTSAIEISRPLVEQRCHQLNCSIPTEPIRLQADSVRLTQVVANILNNAAKYTDKGGQIWIMVRVDGPEAIVSVRDTGIGLAPDMLPRVFDLFAQSDHASNRSHGGLGIGLSLAKKLAELHGGQIDARSEGLGKGSEFTLRIPRMIDAEVPTPQRTVLIADEMPVPRQVLIIDDSPAAAYTLGRLLEKLGHRVSTAHDVATALESIQQRTPDVVISDIAMPEIDGYELARRLRDYPERGEFVLVALTGYGQDSDRERAREAGFDDYLVKPISLESLKALLASIRIPDVERLRTTER